MKKSALLLIFCMFLSACQRPATASSWSPINDAATLPAELTSTAEVATATSEVEEQPSATMLPTLDLTQFPDPLPESMKGYELVSWQVGEDWNFTLITGTNREKTFEELMDPNSSVTADGFVKITVTGVEEIKQALALLPEGSQVFWGGMDLSGMVPEGTVYFSYPPQTVVDDLIRYCAENGVELVNLSEPE